MKTLTISAAALIAAMGTAQAATDGADAVENAADLLIPAAEAAASDPVLEGEKKDEIAAILLPVGEDKPGHGAETISTAGIETLPLAEEAGAEGKLEN